MHIHHVAILEQQNLKQFAKNLLAFIEYLQEYRTGVLPILFGNPVARLLWPPENGWAITLAQSQREMELIADLAQTLREFVVEKRDKSGASAPGLSSIEMLLALNKFIDALPANSLFLLAPGVKEPFGGIEEIVTAAKEILSTKMPEQMTTAIIARELELSLTSIEVHQNLLDNAIADANGIDVQALDQHTSSEQAIAELKLLLANVEKYMCKAYLVDNLLKCLPVDAGTVKEIMEALEKSQYHAVTHRLDHIRHHETQDHEQQEHESNETQDHGKTEINSGLLTRADELRYSASYSYDPIATAAVTPKSNKKYQVTDFTDQYHVTQPPMVSWLLQQSEGQVAGRAEAMLAFDAKNNTHAEKELVATATDPRSQVAPIDLRSKPQLAAPAETQLANSEQSSRLKAPGQVPHKPKFTS